MVDQPQGVKNAIGELVIYALATAADADRGMFIEMNNMSLGPHTNTAIPMGDWKVTIQRTKKPEPRS